MVGVALVACLAGGVMIRLLEKIGHGGVLIMPVVAYGIGYCISRNCVNGRFGAVLLTLIATYSAAALTNVPSGYQMFRAKGRQLVAGALDLIPRVNVLPPLRIRPIWLLRADVAAFVRGRMARCIGVRVHAVVVA
jgi:hypothetical protein